MHIRVAVAMGRLNQEAHADFTNLWYFPHFPFPAFSVARCVTEWVGRWIALQEGASSNPSIGNTKIYWQLWNLYTRNGAHLCSACDTD